MNIKQTIVILGIVLAMVMMVQNISAQPPPQPVTIEGDVVYAANGTRVPDGWIVSITDITTGVLLGTGTTNDVIPAIPQYSVVVNTSEIVVGHVIRAYSESPDGTLTGSATHMVVADDDTPGGTITMPDVEVAALDTTPPIVTNPSATPPSIQANEIETSQLNVTVTDPESGVASVTIDLSAIGGSSTQNMPTIGDNVYSTTTTAAVGTVPGTYNLVVTATNNDGYTNTSVSIPLNVTAAPDTTAPYTSEHAPAKGATGVSIGTNIVVHVKDDGVGVNQSTIVMTVDGVDVTPVITGSPADYTLTYGPPTDFDYEQVVDATIDAADLNTTPNVMAQDAYSFTTELAPPPPKPPWMLIIGIIIVLIIVGVVAYYYTKKR